MVEASGGGGLWVGMRAPFSEVTTGHVGANGEDVFRSLLVPILRVCSGSPRWEPIALNINSKTVLERATKSGLPKPPGLFAGVRISDLVCTPSVRLMKAPGKGFPVENVCLST